ncbi:hypothetical protein GCK72_024519 [Caenorhabditis remanei]|nr:hypothetical protein GCK72_024519 [Caenorhabditis remanei]KAF1748052.1 hypothetical protein GCK72_024519 [Caenorhabditis remanei]
MLSTKLFVVLFCLPVAIFCYKCAVSDSNTSNGVSDCDSSNYCVTINEYDFNGNWVKENRQCSNAQTCSSNGKRLAMGNTLTQSLSTTYECCTGDYCNSATSKGLLALPVMILTYVLFK